MILSNPIDIIQNPNTGGKATNLACLTLLGFNVPQFIVIPSDVIESITQSTSDPETYVRLINEWNGVEDLLQQLLENGIESKYYSVRSSAIKEDGVAQSFAGQFETVLYVSKEELAEAVKKVWLSAVSDHIQTYLKEHQLDGIPALGVVVQEMIPSEVSGVAFGFNPTNGDRKGVVVSSAYGLGEGIVSGTLNTDDFTLIDDNWESSVVTKDKQLVYDASIKSLDYKDVSKDLQSAPSLQLEQLSVIQDTLSQLQKHFHIPQDIEFAFYKERFYLLQTRPVTTLSTTVDKKDEYIVWDNSNIIESYPGVTTPLTFSFIIKMYEAVYIQFCQLMGVSKEDIQENELVFENMLGLLNGRVYYNLLSWYKLLSLLPGYSVNAEFMEKMMGVKERFELPPSGKTKSKGRAKWNFIVSIGKMIIQFRKLPQERKAFLKFLDKTMAYYQGIDLERKSAHELMSIYLDFEKVLLERWKPPLVNDFFAMIYFGTLEKLCKKWDLGPNVHNDLLCGSNDIISTEPITRLLKISQLIQENSAAKEWFGSQSPTVILSGLSTYPEIEKEIQAYIDRFGERCVGELKLETLSYGQAPEYLIGIIQSYVQSGIKSANNESVEKKLRKDAEIIVSQKVKGVKRILFNYVLKHARTLVSSRENLRYERTRGFGMVRKIFSAMGNKFYSEGIIDHHRDIFYLTKEEIFHYINGTSVSTQLKALIELRKKEYQEYEKLGVTDERIPTYGMVYHANRFFGNQKEIDLQGDLKGIGACPGQVKAKVRVVMDPKETKTLDNEILVTSSTDPGWVTLFPSALGIIVERGSLLSHSAIVSRELGIPCVVGVTGLLSRLKTGDVVIMDGSTGEIQIISE